MNKLNEELKNKIAEQKDLTSKSQFKNLNDLNHHISKLEAQVETGKLRLVDEKKALQEISQLKRTKRSMMGLQKLCDSIDTNKKRLEEIKELVRDSRSKELSEEFTSIQNELNSVVEIDNQQKSKLSGLFEKKNKLQKELDELYAKRKELYENSNKAHKEYAEYVKNLKAAEEEREKLQAQKNEENKLLDMIQVENDLAQIPAYQEEIKLCDTLISYLNGGSDENLKSKSSMSNNANSLSSIVQPSADNLPQGKILNKEIVNEYSLCSGSSKKDKKKKGNKESSKIKIPISLMKNFWDLDIKPPSNSIEAKETIGQIRLKKQWYIDNQSQETQKKKELANQKN